MLVGRYALYVFVLEHAFDTYFADKTGIAYNNMYYITQYIYI